MSGIRHARIDCEGNRPCGEWNCDYCHPLPRQPVGEPKQGDEPTGDSDSEYQRYRDCCNESLEYSGPMVYADWCKCNHKTPIPNKTKPAPKAAISTGKNDVEYQRYCENVDVTSSPIAYKHWCEYKNKSPIPGVPSQPQPAESDGEYLKRAAYFLEQAAKMDNAPVVFMVAAAFKNEDRAKAAEAKLSSLLAQKPEATVSEPPEEAWKRGYVAGAHYMALECGKELIGILPEPYTYNGEKVRQLFKDAEKGQGK